MKLGQYCQRQRCRHVEKEQFWQAFASRAFVSNSWAFLLFSDFLSLLTCFCCKHGTGLGERGTTLRHEADIATAAQSVSTPDSPVFFSHDWLMCADCGLRSGDCWVNATPQTDCSVLTVDGQ